MRRIVVLFVILSMPLLINQSKANIVWRPRRLDHSIYPEHDPKLIVAGVIEDIQRGPTNWYPPNITLTFRVHSVILGEEEHKDSSLNIPLSGFLWPTVLVPLSEANHCILVLRRRFRQKDKLYIEVVVPAHNQSFIPAKNEEQAREILAEQILLELEEEDTGVRQRELLLQIAPILKRKDVSITTPFLQSKNPWVTRAALAGLIYATEDEKYIRMAAEDVQEFLSKTTPLDLVDGKQYMGSAHEYFFHHYFFLRKRSWTWGSRWNEQEATKHLRILNAMLDMNILKGNVVEILIPEKPDSPGNKHIFYCEGRVCRLGDTLRLRQDATNEDLETAAGLKGITGLTMGVSISGAAGPFITDEGLVHIKKMKDLKVLGLSFLAISDEGLECIAGLTNLEKLTMIETNVTNAGLTHLSELMNLQELWLDFNPHISDEGIVHLRNLKNLRVLRFFQSPITDSGFENFENMVNLTDLQVGKSRITDKSMKIISRFQHLRTLDLQGTKITDAGLVHFTTLTELQWLCLNDTNITDKGIKYLVHLSRLEWLFLDGTKISDVGSSSLRALGNLKSLSIEKTNITDQGLEHLLSLNKLERIRLSKTSVSQDGLEKLKKMASLRTILVDGRQVYPPPDSLGKTR